MTKEQPMLVVLLETHDIRRVLKNWPEAISAAVCLSPDGMCRVVIFHEDEREVIPRRLSAMMDETENRLQLVPEMRGYPTFSLRYSDEIALLSILAETDGLLDEAEDYAANYTFAMEEGLSPAKFMGLPVDEPAAARAPQRGRKGANSFGKLRPKSATEMAPLLTTRHKVSVESARRFVFSSVRRGAARPAFRHYA